jgi:hypothetical protein
MGPVSKSRSGRGSMAKLEAIIWEPAVGEIARLIPPKGRYGRPRHYHPFVWVVYLVASVFVWESAAEVEEEFNHPEMWGFVCRKTRERFPDHPEIWPRDEPMRRHHFVHALSYLRDPNIQSEMRRILTRNAVALAQKIGLIREDQMGSWTYPNPANVVTFDGKVLKPVSSWPEGSTWVVEETGEIKARRYDPDAAWHRVGDNEDDEEETREEAGRKRVYGVKHGMLSAGPVILGVGDVPRGGGEPALAEQLLAEVQPLAPGIQVITTDGILRGVHINHLMKKYGILPVSPVKADRRDKPRKGERRGRGHYEAWHIEDQVVRTPEGTKPLRALGRRGHAGYEVLAENGERLFELTPKIRTQRRGKPGSYSFHSQYQLPPDLGGRELSLQHNNTREKDGGRYRAEHLRPIAKGDRHYDEVYGTRNRSESHNSGLERTLVPWHRAHSFGATAQLTDMIGFALGQNAVVRQDQAHRKKQAEAA